MYLVESKRDQDLFYSVNLRDFTLLVCIILGNQNLALDGPIGYVICEEPYYTVSTSHELALIVFEIHRLLLYIVVNSVR